MPVISQNPLQPAKLLWEENIPSSASFGDIYFSLEDGVAESTHVFLSGNNLAARFAQLVPDQTFVIGETGFGTGLNFLLTFDLWKKTAPDSAQLFFISTELFPFTQADLTRALSVWPALADLSEVLLQHYPPLIPGFHWLRLVPNVTLLLLLGDARETLPLLHDSSHADFPVNTWQVDAWFLDGFAPAKNPQLWQTDLLDGLAKLSKKGTTLATFSAAGDVRRSLQSVGFSVEKTEGFGRKCEMIRAVYSDRKIACSSRAHRSQTPWLLDVGNQPAGKNIVVIGGGLAGCHIARVLGERGCAVTLVEQNDSLASEASGNPQGALYTKISGNSAALPRFSLSSFLFALRHYRQPLLRGIFFDCGMLQLRQKKDSSLLDLFQNNPELLMWLDQQQACEQAGVSVIDGSFWLPQTGWTHPRAVCDALVQHKNIQAQTALNVAYLQKDVDGWMLLDAVQNLIVRSDHVILACANRTLVFEQSRWLPLRPVRGQISILPATAKSEQIKCVICNEGYVTPACNGQHCLGASYVVDDVSTELRESEFEHNLNLLEAISPELRAAWSGCDVAGRAALRATTPDHLPLVGALPDRTAFLRDFAALSENGKAVISQAGSYIDGLWVFSGFGGRGLCYIPLAAELLASQLLGQPRPLSRDLQMALAPARFVIRELIRRQAFKEQR